ncbi:MAG: glucose-6-phosphate isomerase [Nitrospinales bacterium]
MSHLKFDDKNTKNFISDSEIEENQKTVNQLHSDLEKGTGAGSKFLGWLHLPSRSSAQQTKEIKKTAEFIRNKCEAFICIGIGGSYLGTRAAISFSKHTFFNQISSADKEGPEIYFAGQNISSDYISDLIDIIANKSICINVISKSGTTTEPAIAFRILKQYLEDKVGVEEANKRILVTTDGNKGALKSMADISGYKTFTIPDDVGGRYSVLTPVGLLPIAIAGIDIDELVDGAKYYEELTSRDSSLDKNIAYRYAVIRSLLYAKGKTTEIMASFHPSFEFLTAWWKQLAGESEGKNGQGIFPASVEYTSDLHSLGQLIQEGNRNIFETFLLPKDSNRQVEIPGSSNDADGLNYIQGKSLDFINDKAYKGTAQAHLEGGVPNMSLTVKDRSPYSLGQLIYFFERSVALSGYLAGVNPFDQPGVEFYKKNMFKLLNKPGF